jgi:glycosyltransferase involved in cell wall biosynthesis
MRILQVVSDTDRRGAQVFATDLEPALRARGHEVQTIALVPGTAGGLEVEALGARWRSARVLRELRSRMARVDVTVAHGSSTGAACALAGIGPRRPVVYRQISDSRFWAPTRRKRAQVRATLASTRVVVALSEFNRNELVEWIGVRPDRIVVVPNGVPAERFPPATATARAGARTALGIPDASTPVPVAVFVGALAPEKGADLAIRAVGGIDGAHLVVAGAGSEADRLARLAAEVAPGRVHFAGTTTDAAPLYHAADLLVLPSRGGDAMPAVIIEAGLCGLPVVSTAVGAIPEMVVDGETGYVLEPDDLAGITERIGRLLNDPVGGAAMGAAARERCLDRYEIARVAEGWDAALRRAADTR